ncbi:hypothetical protein DJ019_04445 [Phenylobacterium kunshanense]|uniref:Uncharacterized protein n=1 Tax=Phenylobacterium kunshanense TaxID=1445034 RepID=A0A328BI83_9CAUL|nr:hypothetical protein DJ019_04445 [Phenylobacterium kunshanense]
MPACPLFLSWRSRPGSRPTWGWRAPGRRRSEDRRWRPHRPARCEQALIFPRSARRQVSQAALSRYRPHASKGPGYRAFRRRSRRSANSERAFWEPSRRSSRRPFRKTAIS